MEVHIDLEDYIKDYRSSKGISNPVKESILYNRLVEEINDYTVDTGNPSKVYIEDMKAVVIIPLKDYSNNLNYFFDRLRCAFYNFIYNE